jgi:hypothetical protein
MSIKSKIAAVKASLLRRRGGVAKFNYDFNALIRQALDEVIDNARTGRTTVAELEKTEKTYIGTKVEILTRNLLRLSKGEKLDLHVANTEVDVKFSVAGNWMIPMEAINEICLVIYGDELKNTFGVGLLHMSKSNLTLSQNRDMKRKVTAVGATRIVWLAQGVLRQSA